MDNLKIVNLLASLTSYIPQNKAEVLSLFGKVWNLLLSSMSGILGNTGINFHGIINNFSIFFTKYFFAVPNLIIEPIKKWMGWS